MIKPRLCGTTDVTPSSAINWNYTGVLTIITQRSGITLTLNPTQPLGKTLRGRRLLTSWCQCLLRFRGRRSCSSLILVFQRAFVFCFHLSFTDFEASNRLAPMRLQIGWWCWDSFSLQAAGGLHDYRLLHIWSDWESYLRHHKQTLSFMWL